MEGRPPYLAPDLWSLFPDRLDAEGKPEGWKSGTLNDFVSILETGGRPKGGVSAYREGVPSIGAESIVGLGIFDYNKTKFIPRPYFEKMTKGHIQSRDVLLYKDGGRPGEFEPHATLFGDGFPFEECAINEHVYRIRATPDFGQNLLYFSLTSEATMAEMRLKGTGVAIPGLNSTQARSLTLLLPSRTAAEGFERTTEPFIGRVLANCKEAKTLAATRDLLLPRLMSGELRVKDAERVVETAA
jgi:type I restriction enzyme S subunit